MESLNIKIHRNDLISIKDLLKDLDISDSKWDSIFQKFNNLYDVIYFKGSRAWSKYEDLDKTLGYLSEHVLKDSGKNHKEILFRLKKSSIMYNRRLISQLWAYYEYPCFIFLRNQENEEDLINASNHNNIYDDILDSIPNTTIIYRSFEQNVLWISANIKLDEMIGSIM